MTSRVKRIGYGSAVAGRITLVPYDPAWPDAFKQERTILESVLATWLAGPGEHIGATAVPGLEAKPILDMIAPVTDLASAADAAPLLVEIGYVRGSHRPLEAHYFYK